ncbi:Hepatocyte nuclear factor 6 [Eumeta japonica]|uniref:Hepatocyte nuclear factor 6 n=1 Tax=Eumeta variegata TaxID=151549 RepID=A0A4C1UX10_EUMVA|nr:Hepatocyte nuclear factor 6 [Eumeta japonica]
MGYAPLSLRRARRSQVSRGVIRALPHRRVISTTQGFEGLTPGSGVCDGRRRATVWQCAGVRQSLARPRRRRLRVSMMDETRARDRAPLTVIVAPGNASPPRLSPGDLLPEGEAAFHPLAAVNGRLTPPGLEPASYATLTPLLPLPPISTVSDKFAYHAGGTFTVIQQQQSYASLSPAPYAEPLSPQSAYSRRSASPGSFERRSPTPPLPSPGLDLGGGLLARDDPPPQQTQNDTEEINTKELAQRISGELKRYSIPQAIFAQRVLCRSQGTLSDLLRNPKPWSKLKSGRETFRRMWKWLQEPEFQRMSALRLAGTRRRAAVASGARCACTGLSLIYVVVFCSTSRLCRFYLSRGYNRLTRTPTSLEVHKMLTASLPYTYA